jgi:hypothetical protein
MNNENEIARVVAGKILDEVLPQPKQEYTLEELLAELDRRWAQSHGPLVFHMVSIPANH